MAADGRAAPADWRAFHRRGAAGDLLAMLHLPPAGVPVRGAILCAHAFAEEMNKARRMATLLARALAASGWIVMAEDAYGCGDSAGDFGDATWEGWVADTVSAWRWLAAETGTAPWLAGLRAGCLLAGAAAAELAEPPGRSVVPGMLFWQPVVSGKQHLQQFLRLKTAGALFDGAAAGDVARATRAALDAGETVEIAGYRLSSALARGLEAARLAPPGAGGALLVFEVGASEPPALSPAVQALAQTWRAVDWSVDARPVRGPAFWQTQEIEIVPGLIEATLAASAGAAAAAGAP